MNKLLEKTDGESQWLPISDLMSVLMMVFVLIAISYMLKVYQEKDKIEQVAIMYNKLQNELYDDLETEFEQDLQKWNAELDQATMSVRFKAPDVLFETGSAEIRPKFQTILDDFFPRFIQILFQEKYRKDIEEIRIEGHTSTQWNSETSELESYLYNMELSQDRTRNVLSYVIHLSEEPDLTNWVKSNLTANGLSSSKIVLDQFGKEDKQSSKRVEFKVKTNAEKRLATIINN